MNTLKKFIHYYGPYKTVFFIDLLCAAIISLVDLAYPQILRSATKTLFTQDKAIILQALPWIAIGLFMMYVIQSFCKYYVSCQGHIMGAKMERDMRQELFEHYEELSFSYYSQNNSGQMMSKLVSDLFDISEFAHHGPENLFISLVKIVGSFIFLFLINKKLALPLIVLVILMFLFSFRQNQKMQRTFMENRKKIGDVNASLQDTLSGIRVVQSFTNEEIEKNKFQKSNHAFLVSKKDNYRCMGEFMSSNLFFQGMMYLVTLVYGGYLIANNEMSAADLAMYALYIGIFISPIQILVELIRSVDFGIQAFVISIFYYTLLMQITQSGIKVGFLCAARYAKLIIARQCCAVGEILPIGTCACRLPIRIRNGVDSVRVLIIIRQIFQVAYLLVLACVGEWQQAFHLCQREAG